MNIMHGHIAHVGTPVQDKAQMIGLIDLDEDDLDGE